MKPSSVIPTEGKRKGQDSIEDRPSEKRKKTGANVNAIVCYYFGLEGRGIAFVIYGLFSSVLNPIGRVKWQ